MVGLNPCSVSVHETDKSPSPNILLSRESVEQALSGKENLLQPVEWMQKSRTPLFYQNLCFHKRVITTACHLLHES